ncbi:RNA polymerase sigma factor [Stutzerimonas urumqiensis]|uniref:RNA polymerase sigma factor n=1 Tax=Stutzerimonas urumqiensis TaxID=638269 RepID=UPI003DA555E4
MTAEGSSQRQWVETLYRDHHGWLLGWLRRKQPCPQRAEDLSQDAFVRLLGRERMNDLREPRALLLTIARGLLIDHFRRSDLEQAYLEALAQVPEGEYPSTEEQALAIEALEQVERLLDGLSARARAAFLYNRLDGMSHAEIAERLGVSVPRVRQYLTQGMRQCYVALYGTPT